jgi:DNA-directed RNA polymerase specialized sigma24 family protein
MKRKDFYQLVQPLTDKLYRFAFNLIPDDLQAEQLVVDSLNAYLLKEKKHILRKEVEIENKKELQVLRRIYFKGVLRYMGEIGVRRSTQLNEQMKMFRPEEFAPFYSLEPKVRFVLALRYQAQFSAEEIQEIVQMPRYEVIEKIHNGRFLLMNDLNKGVSE